MIPTARAPLTVATIVESALQLAREHGVDAVSMRRIAGRLDVQAMSLYHHIPSKTVLQQLMIDHTLHAVATGTSRSAWRPQVRRLLTDLYQAAVDNPVLAAAVPTSLDAGAPVTALTTRINPALAVLLDRSHLPATALRPTHLALLAVTAAFAHTDSRDGGQQTGLTPVIDRLLT